MNKLAPQTYPFTRYYIRVPGEHAGTWVPVRIGSCALPETWEYASEAFAFAAERELPEFRVIAVTEDEVPWTASPRGTPLRWREAAEEER